MSSEMDSEGSFNVAWNNFMVNFGSTKEGDEKLAGIKSEQLFSFWTFLAKEVALSKPKGHVKDKIRELIRLHQLHIINPRWIEETSPELRKRLSSAVKSADRKMRDCLQTPCYQQYQALVELHKDPWTSQTAVTILSGKPDSKSIDFLLGECYAVCMRRFEFLLDGSAPLIAFNVSDFLVSNVFDSERKDSSLIVQRWLEQASRDGDDVTVLLDAHLGLMYKLKKDSMLIDATLKKLSIEDLLSAAERAFVRSQKFSSDTQEPKKTSSWSIDSLWNSKTAETAARKLAEFGMCRACTKKLDPPILERIIVNWLNLFKDPKDSDLDLDVEKFSSLGEKTGLVYQIAFQIYQKFGEDVRMLCVDTFVRGLCSDINRLDVARTNKEQTVVLETEQVVSEGLILLSQVFKDNLTMERECVLTSFSLTPTEGLLNKLTQLAEKSGFVSMGIAQTDSGIKDDEKRLEKVCVPLSLNPDEFEQICEMEVTSLKNGFGQGRTKFRADSSNQEKRMRNLEGLVSIQGDLITEAANYDPVRPPLQTLTPKVLRLPKRVVADLLVVIESPRWHLLTWVLDWHTLEERCLNLMKNPEVKNTAQELKYLVIDYTQFDEWSSDEEITAAGGIETGYEDWDIEIDEDQVHERGLTEDDGELEFNVVQKFEGQEEGETYGDDDISPDDYIPKRWRDRGKQMEIDESESNQNHFLAKTGETDDPDTKMSESLLQSKEATSTKVRQTLSEVVPGLETRFDNFIPATQTQMELRPVFLVPPRLPVSISRTDVVRNQAPMSQPNFDPTSYEVRQKLRELVPGLCDYSFWEPICPVQFDVRVVHVTLANSSQSSTSGVTSSSGILQIGSTRKLVLEPSSQPVESTTPANIQPSMPIKKENETKIQYVYKHGTQTIVVDRPLTEEELSKLKFPLPNNRLQQQHQQMAAVQQAKQPIVVARPGLPPAARVVVPSASTVSSVDTLANTLISQIQTPVQLTPSGQPIKVEDQKPPTGNLPKFQFAFGAQNSNPGTVVKTEPGLVVVKSEPGLEPSPNGKLILTSAQNSSPMTQPKANSVLSKLGQLQPTSQIVVGGGMGTASIQSPILSGQVTLQTTASPSAASHADLIRQLNLARAQGLVVLQQWGDKQVLVHKATGRWIMRQGNRLVTVPPQALGIQAVAGDQTASPTGTTTTTTSATSATPNPMSSSTMEQLREFDSILESKFKTTTSMDETMTRHLVAASQNSPQPAATYVIIAPQQHPVGGNFTPAVVKCEPGLEFTQIKSLTSTSTSCSAPTSPSKPVKIPQSSASASASPLGNSAASLAFAKPSPKPQEDPDTLKRIQQILDDYNEQIRNSPDLQNRPAPRRRTNGPTIVNTTDPVRRKRLSSVSPPPSGTGCDSDVGSPSVVQISSANVIDPGQITTTLKVVQHRQNSPSENSDDNLSTGYSVVRQIVVPPALAASLQASGRQIMVVTGPGGKKMVALKPLYVSSANSTNLINKFVTVSSSCLPARLISTTTTTSSPSPGGSSTSNASSPDTSSANAASMAKALAALKCAVPVSIGSTSITSLSSSPVTIRPPSIVMPSFVVTSSTSNAILRHSQPIVTPSILRHCQPIVTPSILRHNLVTSSPSVILSSSSSSRASSNHERATPSPILVMQTAVTEERPGTPGLGIPMEMTPGQIMEAEISAATFLDDNPDSPFALLSSASSSSLRRRKHEDEESLSETLPENLFTQDLPGSSSDDDDSDIYVSNYSKRKRNISSTSSEDITSHLHKRSRLIKIDTTTRHRNMSQQKSKGIGICINNSSQ